jgi:hypothetical protein
MPGLIDLLLAYGICFGLMNKVEFMRKTPFFDKMFSCSYCTGFHAGWISWVISRTVYGVVSEPQHVFGALLWAFCAAVFCYLVDTLSQFVENFHQQGE